MWHSYLVVDYTTSLTVAQSVFAKRFVVIKTDSNFFLQKPWAVAAVQIIQTRTGSRTSMKSVNIATVRYPRSPAIK